MGSLTGEKLQLARGLVAGSDLDIWLTFVRETSEGADPALALILEGSMTWQSAFLVTSSGRTIAVVGNYDADPLRATGDWDEIIPYVQGIKEPLLEALQEHLPENGKIGVNFSVDDEKSDGLSHGMYLLLEEYLRGTRFEGCLGSAEAITCALRSQKTATEVARMWAAISETEAMFALVERFARLGQTEVELYDFIQNQIDEKGFGYAWDRSGDPIVNFGPNSMIGHGRPSSSIRLEPGQILHIDLGIIKDGYSSDIQRCWFVTDQAEVPAELQTACDAVNAAITAGAAVLRPGVEGWTADAAARDVLVSRGYEEYMHALGHQVGRVAHDGGAILGPRWPRYGKRPFMPILADQVFTLELGVFVEGAGYLGLEEMVLVTDRGVEWMTERQMSMKVLTGEVKRIAYSES